MLHTDHVDPRLEGGDGNTLEAGRDIKTRDSKAKTLLFY